MQAGGCAHAWGALACVHACRFSGDAHVHARPRMHPPRIGSGGACRARGRGEGCGEKCAWCAHACTRLHAAAGHARTRPCSMHLGSGCMSCACMRVGPFSHPCTQAHTLHLPHPLHARASSRPPAPQTPQPPTISTVSNLEARSMSLLGCARTATRQGSAPARAPAAPPETPAAGVRCIIMLQALVPCGVCQACYSVGLSRVWLNAVGLNPSSPGLGACHRYQQGTAKYRQDLALVRQKLVDQSPAGHLHSHFRSSSLRIHRCDGRSNQVGEPTQVIARRPPGCPIQRVARLLQYLARPLCLPGQAMAAAAASPAIWALCGGWFRSACSKWSQQPAELHTPPAPQPAELHTPPQPASEDTRLGRLPSTTNIHPAMPTHRELREGEGQAALQGTHLPGHIEQVQHVSCSILQEEGGEGPFLPDGSVGGGNAGSAEAGCLHGAGTAGAPNPQGPVFRGCRSCTRTDFPQALSHPSPTCPRRPHSWLR